MTEWKQDTLKPHQTLITQLKTLRQRIVDYRRQVEEGLTNESTDSLPAEHLDSNAPAPPSTGNQAVADS